MKLGQYRLVFIIIGLIGLLLLSSQLFEYFVPPLKTNSFSTLYLLGPDHTTENYPSEIMFNQNYSLFLGVINNEGFSVFYKIYIKFSHQVENFPNSTSGTPCSMEPLYEYQFAIEDGGRWETTFNFSFVRGTFGNESVIRKLLINGVPFEVNTPIIEDATEPASTYNLFLELWTYDVYSGVLLYNNTFVNLPLIPING